MGIPENLQATHSEIPEIVESIDDQPADIEGPFIIDASALGKNYRGADVPALADVSFRLRPGEIFGLLGPNGAGKSTTIGILTTRIRPTTGQAKIVGYDTLRQAVNVKRNIAVVSQQPNVDSGLNVRENLLFHAAYFGVSKVQREQRADELLNQLGLSGWGKRSVMHLSGGMLQRLMIARALMTNPCVLFLDEPTIGLDPQSRLFLWEAIRSANKRGVTIVLTTHNLEEADQLCQRVGILDHGKLLALDTPTILKNKVPGGSRLEVRFTSGSREEQEQFLQAVGELPVVENAELVSEDQSSDTPKDVTIIRLYTSKEDIGNEVVLCAHLMGISVRELRVFQPSLENLFIFLTGRELHI